MLHGAWRVVDRSGRLSGNPSIVGDSIDFARNLPANLRRLQSELRTGAYTPEPGQGYVRIKGNGGKRPIVIFSLRDRVVQRSVLDSIFPPGADQVAQRMTVWKRLSHDFSYGGIHDRGVEQAVTQAKAIIASGATYFCRSDIKNYYTTVLRHQAITMLLDGLADNSLADLLSVTTSVTLLNTEELKAHAGLFPTSEKGIAQGNCLSPLLANVYLKDFDEIMNEDGVVCLRYIDDFLLLGKSERAVCDRLKAGLNYLQRIGLDAYLPDDGSGKAVRGKATDKFTFLGCQIHYPRIIPDARSRKRLIDKIQKAFDISIGDMRSLSKGVNWRAKRRSSLVSTLSHVSDVVRAWAGAYGSFCNTELVYPEIDSQIDQLLKSYLGQYAALRKKLPNRYSRDILGIPRLSDL